MTAWRLIQCIDHEPTVRFPQAIRSIGVEAQVIWCTGQCHCRVELNGNSIWFSCI